MVAVAAILELLLLVKEVARMWPALGWPPGFTALDWSKWLWVNMAPPVSAGVLGSWVALGLARRRLPRRDPRERLGRFVARCWLGCLGMVILQALLWP